MFVRYFTHVDLGISEVERRIGMLRNDLNNWAGAAYREGEELRARVGPFEDGYAKEVRLSIGAAEIHRTGLVYPIEWTAIGAESLFPSLTAELRVSHVGPDNTQLEFEGTYDPPLGPVGKVVDRVLLGRLADATVQNWVDRLAEALMSETAFK